MYQWFNLSSQIPHCLVEMVLSSCVAFGPPRFSEQKVNCVYSVGFEVSFPSVTAQSRLTGFDRCARLCCLHPITLENIPVTPEGPCMGAEDLCPQSMSRSPDPVWGWRGAVGGA